jgi:hypothetical protein
MRRLFRELGVLGAASLVILLTAIGFSRLVVTPLEERAARLERDTQRLRPDFVRVSAQRPADQLAAFYRFFERKEQADDWLARLYAAATASGLDFKSADYRLAETRYRIERYTVTLPVAGSYAQVRAFLEAALADIPVLSLDHVQFRRKAPSETRLEAEVALTLHLPRK